ncbi:type I polyketide synthase [Nitrosomonas communis]|uniref:Phenolphthiocerol/phthiocerol polyketide synthase subunit E n=1 Tax=Nitrosomonas communis TaxID=44574 RepID=A0A1I4PLN1_9PROT|nr:type I polyketide synthase [Nitrosomonas communis]SFM28751.1 Acyl transferase domain-containing protein [Nitrosomonas communis]
MDSPEKILENAELDIAIIGMACRFPGANDIESFWRNLREGVESITFLSDEELHARGVPAEVLNDPHYIKAVAQLDDIDCFDASFFGYTPREAAETDPQHRLFLEVAWQALEDAGYDPSRYTDPIGVYAGCGVNTYLLLNLLSSGRRMDKQDISSLQGLMNGNNKDSMTTTVAYKLNLRGPGITVQTACSTSLAATHVACRALLNHETDMALAGGAWVNLLHEDGYYYQPGAILSPDGHCRAFDAKAAGTVIGSGVGIVVLRRLSDALADGDAIHAVIKGSAINNDGSAKVGYTAPSVEGQTEVILAAQAIAGISADTISYVEAHGTGTTLGDPIEIAALTQAFRGSTDQRRFCAIGSVKTNVGHLDSAAGVAGLIKTVLSLKHQMLPPSLNFEQPNPQIDFASSPFYVNTECRIWPEQSTSRRAGVSSFGIGGTNVHMIVEEAPNRIPSGASRDWQLLVLSARSQEALERATNRLQQHLEAHLEQPLADVAYTLQVGRKQFAQRAIALCHDHEDAITLLQNRESERFLIQYNVVERRSVTFLFPGQGAQYIDMARDLYQKEPVFRQQFDQCLQLLRPHLDFDLLAILYPGADDTNRLAASSRLEQTEVTQPALFVIEYALAQLWMSWGIQPASMIGHSVGEYVAACLAGVFSLQDALRLVALRGRLLQQMETGAMLAVMLSEAELTSYEFDGCDLAAINGPALCVLSGPLAAIEAAEEKLTARDASYRRLHVSHAFHSHMVEPLLPAFIEQVAQVKRQSPKIPFFSNLRGDWITPQEAIDPHYWGQHVRGTVRFNDGLHALLADPAQVLVEVGPGETLTTLAQRHPLANPGQLTLSSLPHPNRSYSAQKHLYLTLGKLWLNGVAIDWNQFYAHERRYRVPLPTYPFDRQSYWIKADDEQCESKAGVQPTLAVRKREQTVTQSVNGWLYVPSWQRTEQIDFDSLHPEQAGAYLIFSDEYLIGEALASHLRLFGIEPIEVFAGTTYQRESSHRYRISQENSHDFDQLLQSIREEGKTIGHIFYLWSLSTEDKAESQTSSMNSNFYSLFYLARALEATQIFVPSAKKISISMVTNQMEDVTGNEILCPEKALLYGPYKVIPQEYSNVTCRLIDIDFQVKGIKVPLQLAKQILAESQTDAGMAVVAYRGPHRWLQCFEPMQPPPIVKNRFKSGGVYLITGGLGGVGLTLAEHLARTQQAKLVLLGRSPVPTRERWLEILSGIGKDSALGSKLEKIKQLEALGAEVLVVNANMGNQSELEAAVTQAQQYFGPINGVIHAAGEVSNGLISTKSDEAIARVFAPKVNGMRALQAVFRDDPLDFMLLCSSLATIAGGLNKIDYCAANAYLDAVAHAAYRESAYPIISVNWDSWREVGMAANMDMPEGVGIEPQAGAAVFERIVNGPYMPQVIVSTLDLHTRLSQTQHDLVAQPFTFTAPIKTGRFPRPTLPTAFKSPESELETNIAEIWQKMLGIDAIGVDDNLFELGGDSLLGIQLLSRIRTGFSIDLHPADFFRSPTIASLAALVETKLLDEIECS